MPSVSGLTDRGIIPLAGEVAVGHCKRSMALISESTWGEWDSSTWNTWQHQHSCLLSTLLDRFQSRIGSWGRPEVTQRGCAVSIFCGCSRPSWKKSWLTWSDLKDDSALSRRLDYRPLDVPPNLSCLVILGWICSHTWGIFFATIIDRIFMWPK